MASDIAISLLEISVIFLTLIPFLLKKVALNPKLNQSDGIHPNYEGAKVISETIKESIINLD